MDTLSESPDPGSDDGSVDDTSEEDDGGLEDDEDTPSRSTETMDTNTDTDEIDDNGLMVTVSSVADGDTVDIRYPNGTTETVRLIGVDTPEVHVDVSPGEFEGVPDNQKGRQCLQDWGKKKSSYTMSQLSGASVGLSFDENEGRRGYYGRLLAYVSTGGTEFNRKLIGQGYARVYRNSQLRKMSTWS